MLGRWKAERLRQRRAAEYVALLMHEPDEADAAWLSDVATRGDLDHARWELRYLRRALGQVVAERHALDDVTGSEVARQLDAAAARDPNIARDLLELAERQYNARLSAYRDGLDARGGAPTTVRLGQTLLAFAGGAFRQRDEVVHRAGALADAEVDRAASALRDAFGVAQLPDDLPPSALAAREGRQG
jgi:hypothetical protein